jgi:hypothetical protein
VPPVPERPEALQPNPKFRKLHPELKPEEPSTEASLELLKVPKRPDSLTEKMEMKRRTFMDPGKHCYSENFVNV